LADFLGGTAGAPWKAIEGDASRKKMPCTSQKEKLGGKEKRKFRVLKKGEEKDSHLTLT